VDKPLWFLLLLLLLLFLYSSAVFLPNTDALLTVSRSSSRYLIHFIHLYIYIFNDSRIGLGDMDKIFYPDMSKCNISVTI